jgi:hypothetical protein
MPRMLCDIIADALVRQPDMEMVGMLASREALPTTVEETGADVVVIGLKDSELPEECGRLFYTHPWTRVLGVGSDGRRGFLYELRPTKAPLGELSPQGLVDAIRTTDRTRRPRMNQG